MSWTSSKSDNKTEKSENNKTHRHYWGSVAELLLLKLFWKLKNVQGNYYKWIQEKCKVSSSIELIQD